MKQFMRLQHPGVMRSLPVDLEATRAAGEPLMGLPDERGDLGAHLGFIGRLEGEVASQAQTILTPLRI